MLKSPLLSLLTVIIFPCFLLAQDNVSSLLKNEMEDILRRDGFILSEQVKSQENNELWRNTSQRDRVIKNYTRFYDQFKNKIQPPQCSEKALYKSLIIDGESFYALGSRVFKNGSLERDFTGTFPEYIIPQDMNFGVPKIEVNNDNAYFNFTSYSLLDIGAESNTKLEVDKVIAAKIKLYAKDTVSNSKAFQLSYVCGTFKNHLAMVSEDVTVRKSFNPNDIIIIKDFWDKSSQRAPTDSLLKSFAGVYVLSKQGTSTFKRLNVETSLNTNLNVGIFQSDFAGQVKRQNERGLVKSNDKYKIFIMSKPAFEPIPTRAELQTAWTNVIKSEVVSKELSLNDREQETVTIQLGPINLEMYKMLEVDKDFTNNNLAYKGFLKKPVIRLDQAENDRLGMYTLNVAISIDENYKMSPTSSIYKGDRFNVPLRIFYKNIPNGTRDTLVVFQSVDEVSVRYTNYPIIPDIVEFTLTDTSNGRYKYKGIIPVKLGPGDDLKKSEGIISKYANVTQDFLDSLKLGKLLSNISTAKGKVTENGNDYEIALDINKESLAQLNEDITLAYELIIMHSKESAGSRRITKIKLPVTMAAGGTALLR